MKKFDVKKLLVAMLALIMVFALVACNNEKGDNNGGNGGNGGGGGETTNAMAAKEYFNGLWESTKSLGDTTIAATDDFKIDLDLGITIQTRKNSGNTVADSFDLGVKLSLVMDRDTQENSAVKATLYNQTTGDEWLTAYYFLKDANYIYVDFDGQHIKVGFDTGWNDTYTATVKAFIEQALTVNGQSTSIDAILDAVFDGMGETWTLNNILNNVIKIFGIDLETELSKPEIQNVLSLLGISAEAILPGEGQPVDIQSILNTLADALGSFLGKGDKPFYYETTADGNRINVFDINVNLIAGMLNELLNFDLLSANDIFKIGYEINAEKDIESLIIELGLKNFVSGGKLDVNAVYPYAIVRINEMDIEPIKAASDADEQAGGALTSLADTQKALDFKAAQYKSEFNLEAEFTAKLAGLKVAGFNVNGNYSLKANISVDLLEKDAAANGTKMLLQLKKDDALLAEATFNKGVLTLRITADEFAKKLSGVLYETFYAQLYQGLFNLINDADTVAYFGSLIDSAWGTGSKEITLGEKTYMLGGTLKEGEITVGLELNLVQMIYSLTKAEWTESETPVALSQNAADYVLYKTVNNKDYYMLKDANIMGHEIDYSNLIKTIVGAFTANATEGSFGIDKIENLGTMLNSVLKAVPAATYTKNADENYVASGTNVVPAGDYNFGQDKMKGVLAYIFSTSQYCIDQAIGIGILDAGTTVNNITYKEAKEMYDYITGVKTYADYQTDTTKTDKVTEDKFNEAIGTYVTAQIAEYFAGSAFIDTANPLNTINKLENAVFNGITVSLKDGLEIKTGVAIGGSSIDFGFSVNLKDASTFPEHDAFNTAE